jgi:hypothetical protein
MSQNFFSTLSEKLMVLAKQAKAVLSQDYSLQDLKKLWSLPSLLKQKLSSAKTSMRISSDDVVRTQERWSIDRAIELLSLIAMRYRQQSLGLLIICLLLLLNLFVIAPYSQKVQDQLEMRPAQWSALQSLIKLSKTAITAKSAAGSDSFSLLARSSTVTLLDEIELQKMRNILTTRGMKPNILRLTADNPPRIEFQANDTLFSVLLDALEELRTTWRLYPEQLNVISSSGAGMVNISGVLIQYGGQAEVSR